MSKLSRADTLKFAYYILNVPIDKPEEYAFLTAVDAFNTPLVAEQAIHLMADTYGLMLSVSYAPFPARTRWKSPSPSCWARISSANNAEAGIVRWGESMLDALATAAIAWMEDWKSSMAAELRPQMALVTGIEGGKA